MPVVEKRDEALLREYEILGSPDTITYQTYRTPVTDYNVAGNEVGHFHASDRARANHTGTQVLATIGDVTITVTNLNILDDGVNTTLHFHDADRARSAHTGTQTAATISDFNAAAIAAVGVITASGTYTPTRSAEANLDANVTPTDAQYLRVGATVTVSGSFTADPTTTATATSFELSLPIASNIGQIYHLAGTAVCGATAGGDPVAISGSVANNTAVFTWRTVTVASNVWYYTYSYQII